MPTRYYVSVDDKGTPLRQRSSDREKPYVAACYEGHRFSSTGPNGAYPRKVVEVKKPIEWVARAELPDKRKLSSRSKVGPTGPNYVEFTYRPRGADSIYEGSQWTSCATPEAFLEASRVDVRETGLKVKLFVLGSPIEIRGWDLSNRSA